MAAAAAPAPTLAQTISQTLLDSEIPDARRLGRNTSVLERPHPAYDAQGVRTGVWVFYPRLDAGPGYDGNVFGTPSRKTRDVYIALSPDLYVTSDWGRHRVSASVGADLREYVTQPTENEGAWHVKLDGRLEVHDQDGVEAGVEARKLYNERNSGFYPVGAAAPQGYEKAGGYLRYMHESGRLRAVLAADRFRYTYDNVPARGGGVIDQSFNNQTTTRLSMRGEYALTPDAALFAQFTHTIKSYAARGAQDRSSAEERGVAGFTADVTALVRASVGVGYVSRAYDLPAFRAVSGLAADALVQYFPTQLTTVSGSVRRTVEDSVDFNVSGFLDTQYKLRVDHELLRNLILSAYHVSETDEYRGVSRSDTIATTGLSAAYRLSRFVSLKADLEYVDRSSQGRFAGPTFNQTWFLLTASFQL